MSMDNSLLASLMDDENDQVAAAVESATLDSKEDATGLLLCAMREVCTPEEYNSLVMENATLWEVYGMLDNSQAVMESAVPSRKKVVAKYTRASYLSRATKYACMRLAKNNNDPNFPKYIKYRNLMKDYREKIYTKWESKATREAKRLLRGDATAAASVKDARGRQMEDKINQAIKKVDNDGRNHEAIKK